MKFWDIAGLLKSKTFVLAIAAIVAAIAGEIAGKIDVQTMLGLIWAAIQTINLKDGQLTVEKKVEESATQTQLFNSQNGDPRGGG
jgi:hypothetical protein